VNRLPDSAGRVLVTLAIAVAAGWGAAALRVPLPWMLGPLFSVALLRMGGAPLEAPRGGRELGQAIIGTTLGLYFSPAVLGVVASLAPWIVLGGLVAIGVGYVAGYVLARVAGVSFETAFFGSVPGGATEMAILGERFGARVDRVAAAQSLRIMIVVATFPATYQVLGVHGADPYEAAAKVFVPEGFALLALASAAGGLFLHRLGVGNAWVIGPLLVTIPLTGLGVTLSAVPREVSNFGQLLLGCALGCRFEREFVASAPRFVAAVFLSVTVSMVLSVAFGLLLVPATGLQWPTLVLSMAPGGIAEMALTAKVLRLGVPIVTTFHVTRMVMLVLLTAPIYRWVRGAAARA